MVSGGSGGLSLRTRPLAQLDMGTLSIGGGRGTAAAAGLAAAAVGILGIRRIPGRVLRMPVVSGLPMMTGMHRGIGHGSRGWYRRAVQDDGQGDQGAEQLPGRRIVCAWHRNTLRPSSGNRKTRPQPNRCDWQQEPRPADQGQRLRSRRARVAQG